MTSKNTDRAAATVANVEATKRDAYAAKSGKFTNGSTLISGAVAKTKISRIESHVSDINDYAGFAVYNAAMHNNFDPLARLFAAFVGVKGQLVGEGKTLRQFITKMTTGIDVDESGKVERRMAGREGQKQVVPVTFRVLVDGKRVAGTENAGFIMTFSAWRKLVKDNQKSSKNRESIAGTKAGEIADGHATGEETAPAPSVDSKSGGPLPFASILAQLDQIKDIIATTGNGYKREDSQAMAGKLQELANQLQTRDEVEAMAAEQMVTADEAQKMMHSTANAA